MTQVSNLPRPSVESKSVDKELVAERSLSLSFVAPRHPDGSDWPWLSRIGPMKRHRFTPLYIENTWKKFPKMSRPFIRLQYARAMRQIRETELAFFFSTDINVGMMQWPAGLYQHPKRVYVGFTQDGPWEQKKIDRLSRAMKQLDAVTVFSEDERELYINRYGLQPERAHFIHIHTDEADGYEKYPNERPIDKPYVLSLGSPNRRFKPIARACHELKIPLVIITRPWHKNDSLDDLASLGATIITDANKMKALTYLKHAQFLAMAFETDELPAAFTTIIHGMFMGTPSVVTNCLGMRDYVVDGETGCVTPHDDEAALRDAISRLWNDEQLNEEFSTSSLERARRHHSLEAAAVRFESLARQIVV